MKTISAAQASEDEDNFRLRKAQEHLEKCRELEADARRQLNQATKDRERAKEKYETLFDECEKRAVARRKAGLIEVNLGY